MQVDGLIGIRYRNKLNEDVEADLYLPDYPKLSGECVESNLEIMTMEFKGFTLTMTFKKVCGRIIKRLKVMERNNISFVTPQNTHTHTYTTSSHRVVRAGTSISLS